MIQIERITQEMKKTFVNPLDQRDGHIPSWVEISSEFGLNELPHGRKRLFQAFYRAQRFFALEKKTKGRRLMNTLDNLSHFRDFEDGNANVLNMIAQRVRGKGR